MVGTVLLPALAGQPRLLPPWPRHGGRAGAEQDDQTFRGEILPPLLHPLHQETVRQAEEEVPHYTGDNQDRPHEAGRGRQDWGRGEW